MRFTWYLFFIFLFPFTNISAQEDYEYLGVIQLNDSSFISYKIAFNEKDGLLNGYSVTDMGGAHETRSFISGYYEAEDDKIDFYESGIIYTKSPITQNDFCYVHFEGQLKKLDDRQGIEGNFKGLYNNGEACIDGSINLLNFKKVLKKAKKLDRKIDRTVLVSKEKRDKINLVRDLDSLNMNIVRKNETLNIFTSNDTVELVLFDAGKEDNDRISLFVNGKVLWEDYTAMRAERRVRIPLESEATAIKIVALNNGTIGENTIKFHIILEETVVESLTNLKAGEEATFIIRKK
ncbi:MAG: hypothetical protein DWP94_14845 [Flavobacterium sp.]|nr:MAG: hypothetical protein DWP94_14845 [Flavobacterium sp.]